jgi:RimJ/RimL family protein N-acetyltransferase
MGEGSPDPRPTFCVEVDSEVVGWVDADHEDGHTWLEPHEANLGYAFHPRARGHGYATRAVMLLLHRLAVTRQWTVATLAIDFDNDASLAIARRCGFADHGTIVGENESRYFKRPVPPLTYTDGRVTIRLRRPEDVEAHVAGTDEEQIRWLWPQHRDDWLAMTPEQQLAHVRRVMDEKIAINETGPKWDFGVFVDDVLVGHVDCDLANPNVPHGEANVSYTIWPAHRGNGYASAAARQVIRFVTEHTGAREVHVIADARNEASLRVARAVGAIEVGTYLDGNGDTMVRHVLSCSRS